MTVAIVGGGAMGGIFAARLVESGTDAVLIDVDAALVDAINADGVAVAGEGGDRVVRVSATRDPASVGVVDAVLFFVKCYHTRVAAELARPLVGPDTTVVSLQNGWGNGDVLADALGAERLVVGVTYNSGTVLGIGRVGHTAAGITFLGPFASDDLGPATAFGAVLEAAGFEVTVTAAVRTEVFKKLVLNCATLPTAGLTGLVTGAIGEDETLLALTDDLAAEAAAVARAGGVDIDTEERIEVIRANLRNGGSGKASMLQDLEAGRRTEIDVINGAIVRAADEHGIATPVNRALLAIVKGLERARGLT